MNFGCTYVCISELLDLWETRQTDDEASLQLDWDLPLRLGCALCIRSLPLRNRCAQTLPYRTRLKLYKLREENRLNLDLKKGAVWAPVLCSSWIT